MSELNQGTEHPVGALDEPAPMSLGERLLGIFTDPGNTFSAICSLVSVPRPGEPGKTSDKSKWWIPVLIAAVVAVAVAAYTVPNIVMPEQHATIREMVIESGGAPADADRAIQMSSAIGVPMAVFGAAAGTFVMLFAFAGVLHLVMRLVGGKGRFRHARAIVGYSMLVGTLGSLIKLPLMIARKTLFVETSPTILFRSLEPSDRLYRILSGFDVFTIWWVVLLFIGLSIGYRVSRGKAAVAVVVLWLILVLIGAFMPQGGFAGGPS